jgi:hypothetical protein
VARLHNDPVRAAVPSRLTSAGVLLAAGVLALTGCSGGGSGPDIDTSSAPPTPPSSSAAAVPTSAAPSTPTLPVPAGVELTAQGSQLAVGATATVAYQPRQDLVGVLDITVTRIEQTTIKKSFAGWQVDEAQQTATPYFVRATVTNRGDSDLGGRRVPLYAVDATNTLVESTTFASAFTPCEPTTFPKKFKAGKSVDVCAVYLVPAGGQLTAVSFRPSQDYDPITWTGPVEKVKRNRG